MERPQVAVTGLGLVSPAGIGVAANWERVCSGESTARTGMPSRSVIVAAKDVRCASVGL